MSAMVGELHYRKLRAPKQDGEILIDPSAARVGELFDRNLAIFHSSDIDLLFLYSNEGRTSAVWPTSIARLPSTWSSTAT